MRSAGRGASAGLAEMPAGAEAGTVTRSGHGNRPDLIRLHVFDDCVYAYEYALANRELTAETAQTSVSSGLSDGIVLAELGKSSVDRLARRLAYFDRIDHHGVSVPTHQRALSRVSGAIASSSGKAYMTHWMYPYKGKFHPQMVRGLLNVMGMREGETVFDPMTGSGTVNVEASMMGIDSIGIDVSPVGVLATRVKCALLEQTNAASFVEQLPTEPPRVAVRKGRQLTLLQPEAPPRGRLTAASGVSGDALRLLEFEVMSICQNPAKDFATIWAKIAGFYRKTALDASTMVKKLDIRLGRSEVRLGDARDTGLRAESVDGILTSPPYAIALDYVSRNGVQLAEMGYSLDEMYTKTIWLRGKSKDKANLYYLDLEASIREMHRVLRPGRFCVIVIGDTRFGGKLLPTIQRAIGYGEASGFRLVENMRKISAGQWGLFRTESMLLFQKPN